MTRTRDDIEAAITDLRALDVESRQRLAVLAAAHPTTKVIAERAAILGAIEGRAREVDALLGDWRDAPELVKR